MSEDLQPIDKITRIVNDLGAELTAQKVILQLLISQILTHDLDRSEQTIELMEGQVLDALTRTPKNPSNSSNEEARVRALSAEHVKDFFHQLSAGVLALKTKHGQGSSN